MRQMVPRLSNDPNAYRVLLQTVGNVVELEHQLQHLEDQTHQVRQRLEHNTNTLHVSYQLIITLIIISSCIC